jgi:chromosome segregation ATPase
MTEYHDHRDDCPFKFATLDVCDCVEKNMLDRIEALTKKRDQHWDSFVHWRKRADDLTEQLAAARDDAKEAEAYAEEVEKERDDYALKLMQANNTYTEMHLELERLSDKLATCEKYRHAYAECDRIGTQAVRDLEAKLAKAVEALGMAFRYNTAMHGGAGEYNKLIKETIAELTGGKDE